MNKQQLKEWLLARPSHIRDGNSNKICRATGIEDKEFVLQVVKELKDQIRGSEASELSEFQDYLNRNGLCLSDVKNVKFWQNFNGEQRFSVNTKNEWYEKPEEMLESFKEILAGYEYPVFTPSNIKKGDSIAVINLYDAHIDKLVLIDETNPGGSVDANCFKFEDAFDKLLTQTLVYGPETIVFPVGNDFFNANDNRNTTVNGTAQDSNPFWKLSFIKGYEVIRKCIDKASQFAKVEIVMVISNHDADKLFYLGQMLRATYENHPHVNVDDTTRSRKYFKYGSNLLGFSHGHKEKNYVSTLPATIMIENKHIMPEVDYIHHFCGDIHHLEKFQLKTSHDLKGCTISFLRALSDTGKWEYEQGYVGGPKTAESFIFKKDKGLAANLQVHI
jgi:hypothetical protein